MNSPLKRIQPNLTIHQRNQHEIITKTNTLNLQYFFL